MERIEFLKTCGGLCAGLLGLTACQPTRHVTGNIENNLLRIDKGEFKKIRNDKITYRRSLQTKPEHWDYPIAIYRLSDTDYRAFLLRCTHQNNELSLNGDIMSCPAHGSEFNNRGEAIQGPAEQFLQSYKVITDNTHIYIQLQS